MSALRFYFAVPSDQRLHYVSHALFARLVDPMNCFPTLAGETVRIAAFDVCFDANEYQIESVEWLDFRILSFDETGKLDQGSFWLPMLFDEGVSKEALEAALKKGNDDGTVNRVFAEAATWVPTPQQASDLELMISCRSRRVTWCPKHERITLARGAIALVSMLAA
jgi:hypothetical protein